MGAGGGVLIKDAAIGGYGAMGIFCLVAVAFSASVMRLFMREPDGTPVSTTS